MKSVDTSDVLRTRPGWSQNKYIARALAATSDEDSGLAYLNRVHRDLLPDVVKRDQ